MVGLVTPATVAVFRRTFIWLNTAADGSDAAGEDDEEVEDEEDVGPMATTNARSISLHARVAAETRDGADSLFVMNGCAVESSDGCCCDCCCCCCDCCSLTST